MSLNEVTIGSRAVVPQDKIMTKIPNTNKRKAVNKQ